MHKKKCGERVYCFGVEVVLDARARGARAHRPAGVFDVQDPLRSRFEVLRLPVEVSMSLPLRGQGVPKNHARKVLV